MAHNPAGATAPKDLPSFNSIALLIAVPLFLILVNTFTAVLVDKGVFEKNLVTDIMIFLGHPFSALIIAALLAVYFLGIRRGKSKQELLDLSNKALGPAGIIILVVVLEGVLAGSGIEPAAGIALILGVDRILDMCRTAVNVTGDLTAAAVIERSEYEHALRGGGAR